MKTYNLKCQFCGIPLPDPNYRLSQRNIAQRTCKSCKAKQCRRDGRIPMERNAAIEITPNMEQVIIGTLLGDGCFAKPPKGSINWGLEFKHSTKQDQYARYKALLIEPIISKINNIPPNPKPTFIKGKKVKDNGRTRVRTIRHPYFTELSATFIQKGKKVVPSNIGSLLGPLALAIWHLDDGCYTKPFTDKRGYSHKSVIRLCSFGFSTEENTLLRETLFNNFGLISKPFYSNKQKQYEGIALRGDQANMFLDIINPFLSGTGLEYKGGIK